MPNDPFKPNKAQLKAIGRSFDVYYRDGARTARMDRLHAQLVPPNALAFDIGAHVGDRTGSFLRLGAKVVALEPQPHVFRALRLIYAQTHQATLLCQAAGAAPGTIELNVNSNNPTITTASPDLIHAAQTAEMWQGQVWDRKIKVPVSTLDALITQHDIPDFVKIDVEGHELAVLNGLSQPLPLLSFEFTTIQRDVAADCINRLTQLGNFEYNLSLGEDHALGYDRWIRAKDMQAALMALPTVANSGDVFARLLR